MQRSLIFLIPLVMSAILHTDRAQSQVYQRFELDPARSFMAFDSGDVSAQLGDSLFPFAPITAQPGTTTVPLSGHLVIEVAPSLAAPGFVGIVPGTTDIRPANANIASPGLGAAPGSASAAFGLHFEDSFAGVSGDVALRDLVFGLQSGFDIFSNAAGPLGLRGTLAWIQARGTYDLAVDIGLEESLQLAALPLLDGYLISSTSQFEEVSPGIYEVTLPFFFWVGSFDLPGPISSAAATLSFSGEIVATSNVPEPGLGVMLAVGSAVLAALPRRGGRQ